MIVAGLQILYLTVSVLPAASAEGDIRADQITIYTQFAHTPSALSIEHMKRELDAIMAPLSLHFGWRSLERANGHDAVAEIVVVNFQGTCRSDIRPPGGSRNGPLGQTHITDGQILPFTEVDCDRIREVMAMPLSWAVFAERERLLGRAMARVLAHELYHFFTNTIEHAHSGLAKPCYTGAELGAEQFRFDDAELRKLRSGRLRGMLNHPHDTAVQASDGF